MELQEIAKIIAQRYMSNVEREQDRDAERSCSLELNAIWKELDFLQLNTDEEIQQSAVNINTSITLLADHFQELGFEKGFLYAIGFLNEIKGIRMDNV